MSFYEVVKKHKDFDYAHFFQNIREEDVLITLSKEKINEMDFLTLLSPRAEKYLEDMAQKAHQISLQHFGKSILLYTPMYLSNYCINRCRYCSYNIDHKIHRKTLSLEEIEEEAKSIAKTGLKHILILTGESKKEAPISYIIESVKILKKYFESISIEIYPLTKEEYEEVIGVGVHGLTIYQEVYDENIYDEVHISGPKKNYHYRLDAPERACSAKIRSINIGALLGLNAWRKEAYMTGLHGKYLSDNYGDTELSISLPRIRPHVGGFEKIEFVEDKNLVQMMLALRIFLPFAGITISTRESKELRDHLIPLGVTKMSAGVSTEVGGHSSEEKGDSQFEISDIRSVIEIKEAILQKGYQPIFKDWINAI